VAPNLLDQDFTARRPDEKWGADLSYIWTREGWLYRAVVMDLYARRVVGWAVSDRLHKELALAALRRALGDDQGLVCFIIRTAVARADSSGRRNGWAEGGCDGGSAAFGSGPAG
jgi:transposase InsO family protein